MDSTIEKLMQNIPVIKERNYWLIRTNKRIYYEDFLLNGYVAINWDIISVDFLQNNKKLES